MSQLIPRWFKTKMATVILKDHQLFPHFSPLFLIVFRRRVKTFNKFFMEWRSEACP
jgi:hypothetical protein